jgi:hypothetical protein
LIDISPHDVRHLNVDNNKVPQQAELMSIFLSKRQTLKNGDDGLP